MKYRILIVEDNIMLAGQQKKWLEKSGYEAEITIDEPGARKLLKKESFDLVLSDVRLTRRKRYIFARMDAEGTDGYSFHYHDRICFSTGCCASHNLTAYIAPVKNVPDDCRNCGKPSKSFPFDYPYTFLEISNKKSEIA